MKHRRGFDAAAARYDAFADIQREMAAWLAEWIPEDRHGDALEIAAGTGLFTGHLTPWRGCLTATDLSPQMVAAGRQRLPEIRWLVRDAAQAHGREFDWIFSCSFLQWCDDPETLLETWRKNLNPGGRVLAGFFVNGAIPELHRLLGPHAPIRYRESDEWRRLFTQAGFVVEVCDTHIVARTYPAALDLFRRLHGVGATRGPRLTVPEMRALLRAYETACAHPEGIVAHWHYCRVLASV